MSASAAPLQTTAVNAAALAFAQKEQPQTGAPTRSLLVRTGHVGVLAPGFAVRRSLCTTSDHADGSPGVTALGR